MVGERDCDVDRFRINLDAFLGFHNLCNMWVLVMVMSGILAGVLCIFILGV